MLKYARVIDDETKQCEVGIGDNVDYYLSVGMDEFDVEQAHDGSWYLVGHVPGVSVEVRSDKKRAERDELLEGTDKYMLSDYPVSDGVRGQYVSYRQYLRDLPDNKDFPDVEILQFNDWVNKL